MLSLTLHANILFLTTNRSDLVSDMVEKKVPFSEWEHYTVRAWLEVPPYTQCLICLVCVPAQVWVGIPFWYTSALRENVQNGATLEVQPSLPQFTLYCV